ncbi:MAG: ankyrin repeat domain-containing protein [Candidatus Micrarchaeaceae archaeon]
MVKLPKRKRSAFDVLYRIIKKGDVISLRSELDAGTNPNLSNRFAWMSLMLAALEGNLKIGEMLISRGADVNATNKFGETALSLAAHHAHMRSNCCSLMEPPRTASHTEAIWRTD